MSASPPHFHQELTDFFTIPREDDWIEISPTPPLSELRVYGDLPRPAVVPEEILEEYRKEIDWLDANFGRIVHQAAKDARRIFDWQFSFHEEIDDARYHLKTGAKDLDLVGCWGTIRSLAAFLEPRIFKGPIDIDNSYLKAVIEDLDPWIK